MPLIAAAGTAAAESYGYEISPARDRYFPVTTTLIPGNGTNGATNSAFVDSGTANSGSGWPVTTGGNATQGTASPFSVPSGRWSCYFNSEIINTPAAIKTAMGTTGLAGKKFTMECFIYPQLFTTGKSGLAPIFGQYEAVAANGRWFFGYSAISTTLARLSFTYTTGTGSEVTALASTSTIPVSQWSHVAVTIDATTAASTTISFFVNGSLVSTSTGNNMSTQTSYYANPGIGFINDSGSYNRFVGYISNLRIIYGTLVYTGNYTVPRNPLTVEYNTVLLTCQRSSIIDASPNALTLTNGNSTVVPFGPFLTPYPYSPGLNSGSMGFDGVGDYVSIPDNAALELGSNDFCFECLFLTNNVVGTATLIQKRSGTAVAPIIVWRSTSSIQVYLGSVTQGDIVNGVSLGTVQTGQWYHVSVYRIGTTVYGSLNGIITTLKTGTSLSVLNNTDPYTIGANGNGTSEPWAGLISNVRLVIGDSVYTSTSAPIPTKPLLNITNTKFLLLGTNAGAIDNTSNLVLGTINTSISNTQSKYGNGSIFFNGTNAYITVRQARVTAANILPVLGDMTTEVFIRPTAFTALQVVLFISGNGSGYAAVRLDIAATTGIPTVYISSTGAAWAATLTSSTALTAGNWAHIAVVRNAGTFTLYLNGVSVATSTAVAISTALLAAATTYISTPNAASSFFNGYMYGLRISNVARYTANFTPPTGPYPIQS